MQSHALLVDLYCVLVSLILLNIFYYMHCLTELITWIFIFNIHSSNRYLSLMLDVLIADVRVVIT